MTPIPHRRDHGFTLIETLVTLLLGSLVILAVFQIFTSTKESYRAGTENIDGQQNARAALNWMARELRSAKGYNLINADEVTFLTDANTPNQARTFRLDTGDQDGDGDTSELLLVRNPEDDGTPGVYIDEIAVGVDSLAFVYRDVTGAVTTSRAAVHEIEVIIFAQGNSMRDGSVEETAGVRQVAMSTRIRSRNVGKSVPTEGDETAPAAPTNLVAAVGCGTATLTWTANTESDLAGYFLSYATNSGSPYDGTDAAQGASPIFVGSVVTYTLTGLDASTTYYFSLQAIDSADNISGFSNEASGTPSDLTAPSVPTGLIGRVVDNDKIELSWDSGAEWDLATYEIYYYGLVDSLPRTTTVASSPTTISGLSANDKYYFSIRAADGCGNESAYSSEIYVTMTPCDEDTSIPSTPSNLAATAGDEFVQLNWDLVPENDITGYQVFFRETGASYGTTTTVGNVTSHTIYGLTNGVDYEFQVAALDGCGHTSAYTGAEESTPEECADNAAPPSAPQNLTLTDLGGGAGLSASWTRSSDGDVIGYNLYWGTSSGSYSNNVDVGNNIFYTVSGLSAGVDYYFAVTAYDICNNESGYSSEATTSTEAPCSCVPTVTFTSPSNGATVSGTVAVTASASPCSTGTVDYVEFYVNGSLNYTDTISPYEYGLAGAGWDTTFELDGAYTLMAVAYDDAGCSTADTLSVNVDNSGLGVDCIAIDTSFDPVISDTWDHVIEIQVENQSTTDTFELDQIDLSWDLSGHIVWGVVVDGVWHFYDSSGDPSGSTLNMSPNITIPASSTENIVFYMWDDPIGYPPDVDVEGLTFTVTFREDNGTECGPYNFAAPASASSSVVTVVSHNGSDTYEVVEDINLGDELYVDRSYTITQLPAWLDGAYMVKTPNDDKYTGNSFELELEFGVDVDVWIAYDDDGWPPDWIDDYYTHISDEVHGSSYAGELDLFQRSFSAGTYTFSGNKASGYSESVGSHYVIFVLPQ